MAKTAEEKSEPKYTKEQIMKAAKVSRYVDAVAALLEDGKTYTMKEVQDTIDKFMKGEVK